MTRKRIERSEWVYLALALTSIAVLVAVINVPSLKGRITDLNPVWQFIVLNVGLYVSLFLVAKSVALRKNPWRLTKATLGGLLVWLSLDTLFPEYHVDKAGLHLGGIFGASSTDYFFGYILQELLGLTGWSLVVAVYIVIPLVLLVAAAYLIKNFIRSL